MQDAQAKFRDSAARFDEFLKRATAEFGGNDADRAETDRRVDEWLRRKIAARRLAKAA